MRAAARARAAAFLAAALAIPGVLRAAAPAEEPVRTIHVFVALCDNKHQGIEPVPEALGDGQQPRWNLYWGAMYGVKTYFEKSDDWALLSTVKDPRAGVLERCVFKHKTAAVYLVADAYDGREIKRAVADFLDAAAGKSQEEVTLEHEGAKISLNVRGAAALVAYVGHNALMECKLDALPEKQGDAARDAIVLCCSSRAYFTEPLRTAGARALLLTTGLMAPEAYTLKAAIDGWILNESAGGIRLRAAQAYHDHQECSLAAARRLFYSSMVDDEVSKVSRLLEGAGQYTYEIGPLGSDKTVAVRVVGPERKGVIREVSEGVCEADAGFGCNVVPYVLRRAFGDGPGAGAFITIRLGEEGGTYTMHTKGLAEAVYALRILAPRSAFDEWIEEAVPLTEGIEEQSKEEACFPAVTPGAPSQEMKGLIDRAKASYAERRAELVRRFSGTCLFYGAVDTLNWGIESKGESVVIVGSCADLMMVATFRFEFNKGEDGQWRLARIIGCEWFKGE